MVAFSDCARLVGYARVSTQDQNLSLQIDALLRAGVSKDLIFTDKVSGAKYQRPGLDACIEQLCPGDVLLVWRLDRLGRTTHQLVNLLEQFEREGIRLRSLQDGIDPTSVLPDRRLRLNMAFTEQPLMLISSNMAFGLAEGFGVRCRARRTRCRAT